MTTLWHVGLIRPSVHSLRENSSPTQFCSLYAINHTHAPAHNKKYQNRTLTAATHESQDFLAPNMPLCLPPSFWLPIELEVDGRYWALQAPLTKTLPVIQNAVFYEDRLVSFLRLAAASSLSKKFRIGITLRPRARYEGIYLLLSGDRKTSLLPNTIAFQATSRFPYRIV